MIPEGFDEQDSIEADVVIRKGKDEVIGLLARNRGELRRLVARKLTLKFAPDLRFKLDETFDRMDQTREMLNRAEVRRDTGKKAGEEGDPG